MEVSWIELEGVEAIYAGETPWKPDQPLTVVRHSTNWRCESCESYRQQVEARKRAQLAARVEQSAARVEPQAAVVTQRDCYQPTHFRVVDFYYPSGKFHRAIFWVGNRVDASCQVLARYLKEDGELLFEVKPPFDEAKRRQLQTKFDGRLRWYEQRPGVIVDAAPQKKWFDLSTTEPPSRRWNNELWPRRYYYSQRTQRWFIPEYLREVQWFEDSEAHKRLSQAQRIRDAQSDWKMNQRRARVEKAWGDLADDPVASPIKIGSIESLLAEAKDCAAKGYYEAAHALYERALALVNQLLVNLPYCEEAQRKAAIRLQSECRLQLLAGPI